MLMYHSDPICNGFFRTGENRFLPSQENFSPVNTQELRKQAVKYFQVRLNGELISGDLWWGQGNNHIDLNFTFDQPVSLKDGDTLTIWAGPQKLFGPFPRS